MKNKIFCILILFIATNCKSFNYREKLIDDYHLLSLDFNEDMSLSYSVDEENSSFIGIVLPMVFELGYDDNFIIVKQHPEASPFIINKQITNYYIIPLKCNKVSPYPEKNLLGPMNYEKFNIKREELGVNKNLSFTRVFDKLE